MSDPFTDGTTGEKVQVFSHISAEEKASLIATNLVAQHIIDLHNASNI